MDTHRIDTTAGLPPEYPLGVPRKFDFSIEKLQTGRRHAFCLMRDLFGPSGSLGSITYFIPFSRNPSHPSLGEASDQEIPFSRSQALELDPRRYSFSQINEDWAVVWSDLDPSDQFLVRLRHRGKYSLIASGNVEQVKKLRAQTRDQMAGQGLIQESDGFIEAWQATPKDAENYSVAELIRWDPRRISHKHSGETLEQYEARVSQLISPAQLIHLHSLNGKESLPILHLASLETVSGRSCSISASFHFFSWFNKVKDRDDLKIRKACEKLNQDGHLSAFINSFEACEYLGLDFGNKLLEIVAKPEGPQVLKLHAEILETREDISLRRGKTLQETGIALGLLETGRTTSGHVQKAIRLAKGLNDVDQRIFRETVQKKGASLLQAAASGTSLSKLQSDYDPKLLFWGAVVKGLVKQKDPKADTSENIEIILDGTEVKVVQGGSYLIEDASQMEEEENYRHPELFGKEDYKALSQFLDRTYQEIDPGWLAYLKANIGRDLQDSAVRFVLIRRNGALIGIAKIKHLKGNRWYFGTHYVHPQFAKDFNIGEFVQNICFSFVGENDHIEATVALANPSLERHINKNGMIGIGLNHEGASDELLHVKARFPENYISKDKNSWPDQRIQELADRNSSHFYMQGKIFIYRLNTRYGEDRAYRQTLRAHFQYHHVLTRLFYRRSPEGEADLEYTYLVFEERSNLN